MMLTYGAGVVAGQAGVGGGWVAERWTLAFPAAAPDSARRLRGRNSRATHGTSVSSATRLPIRVATASTASRYGSDSSGASCQSRRGDPAARRSWPPLRTPLPEPYPVSGRNGSRQRRALGHQVSNGPGGGSRTAAPRSPPPVRTAMPRGARWATPPAAAHRAPGSARRGAPATVPPERAGCWRAVTPPGAPPVASGRRWSRRGGRRRR